MIHDEQCDAAHTEQIARETLDRLVQKTMKKQIECYDKESITCDDSQTMNQNQLQSDWQRCARLFDRYDIEGCLLSVRERRVRFEQELRCKGTHTAGEKPLEEGEEGRVVERKLCQIPAIPLFQRQTVCDVEPSPVNMKVRRKVARCETHFEQYHGHQQQQPGGQPIGMQHGDSVMRAATLSCLHQSNRRRWWWSSSSQQQMKTIE
mmetsp:Transcript_33298/g.83679  ORF Transcript_33298/g.83679 Transcript_33298/m.83679 type:complete len:206 (-) Transcript_33298:62-679(-)